MKRAKVAYRTIIKLLAVLGFVAQPNLRKFLNREVLGNNQDSQD